MLRILIADDHELARRGIRALLENHPGWEVCAEAKDGRDAVEQAAATKPNLVLLDIGMPNLNGLEAARQILATNPGVAILILTMHDSDNVVREVLRAGARGYVLKSDAGRDLIAWSQLQQPQPVPQPLPPRDAPVPQPEQPPDQQAKPPADSQKQQEPAISNTGKTIVPDSNAISVVPKEGNAGNPSYSPD